MVLADPAGHPFPEETLARWYAVLNTWRWPEDLPLVAPPSWEQAPSDLQYDRQRMADAYDLWEYLKTHTTEQARSRAHWLYVLGKTVAEWKAYWALPVCPSCELRHKDGALHW